MLRFQTAGESHGQALIAILSGLPAGLRVDFAYVDRELKRRQGGYGRGGRMKIESDTAQILSGVRHGHTIGSPITILIENRDWKNWTEAMAVEDRPEAQASYKPLSRPRPGHADLAGCLKYNFPDARYVLERASARETAARVAAGAVAKLFLKEFGIEVASHVVALGRVSLDDDSSSAPVIKPIVDSSNLSGLNESLAAGPQPGTTALAGHDSTASSQVTTAIQAPGRAPGWTPVSFEQVLALRDKEEIVLNCLDPVIEARMKEE